MGKQYIYTKEQMSKVLDLKYKQGMTRDQISAKMGINSSSIAMLCCRQSWESLIQEWEADNPGYAVGPAKRRVLIQSDNAQVVRLFNDGMSIDAISGQIALTKRIVKDILVQNNLLRTNTKLAINDKLLETIYHKRYVLKENVRDISAEFGIGEQILSDLLLGKRSPDFFHKWNRKHPKHKAGKFRSPMLYTQKQVFKVLDLHKTGLIRRDICKATKVSPAMVTEITMGRGRKDDIIAWQNLIDP